MDKKHLFILQDENNNVTIETYTTDDSGGYLKGKTVETSIPNIDTDTRLPLLEAAIYEKIKYHHK